MKTKDQILLEKAYELILESNSANEDLQDFKSEFKGYQDQGAFLKDIDLDSKFNQSIIQPRDSKSLDSVANCYAKLIDGGDEKTRFEQWKNFYSKEKREEGTIRANTGQEKINYLKKLLQAVKENKTSPSIIIQVDTDSGILEFMVGGRTRAAASKVANIKAKIRIIKILPEEIKNTDKVKSIYKQISIN